MLLLMVGCRCKWLMLLSMVNVVINGLNLGRRYKWLMMLSMVNGVLKGG